MDDPHEQARESLRQRLALGIEVERPWLPEVNPGALAEIVIKASRGARKMPRSNAPKIPAVEVIDRVHRLHPVAKELDDLLHRDCHHQYLLAVRGYAQVVLKVGQLRVSLERDRLFRSIVTTRFSSS